MTHKASSSSGAIRTYFDTSCSGSAQATSLLTSNGARKETINIPNVLFVDSKLKAIQQLISVKPDHIPAAVAAA